MTLPQAWNNLSFIFSFTNGYFCDASKEKMLPNFLCVGAQKAGTTTLYEILKQHPDIFLPKKIKETKFFVFEEKYQKGKAWYESAFFSEWKNEHAVGEVDLEGGRRPFRPQR